MAGVAFFGRGATSDFESVGRPPLQPLDPVQQRGGGVTRRSKAR